MTDANKEYDVAIIGGRVIDPETGLDAVRNAPALSRVAAALATGQSVPGDILEQGLDPDTLSPARLKAAA